MVSEELAYEAVIKQSEDRQSQGAFGLNLFGYGYNAERYNYVMRCWRELPEIGDMVYIDGHREEFEVLYIKHYVVHEWWEYTDEPPVVVLRKRGESF